MVLSVAPPRVAALLCFFSAARGGEAVAADPLEDLRWWSPKFAFAEFEKVELANEVQGSEDVDPAPATGRSLRQRRAFMMAPESGGENSLMQLGESTQVEKKVARTRTASMRGVATDAVNNSVSISHAGATNSTGGANGTGVAAAVVNVSGTAATAQASEAAVSVNVSQTANMSQTTAATGEKAQQPMPPTTVYGWLRMSLTFTIVVKTLCMLSNILFQASPLPQIKAFHDNHDTGDVDSAPFVSIAYGSSQWCFYGMFAYLVTGKTGFLVLVYSNVVGACLGIMYVFTFYRNCRNEKVQGKSNFYFQVLGSVIIFQIACMSLLPSVRALFISGLISSAWSIVGSLSLLTTAPNVIKTKCSKSLPLPLLVCAFMSAVIWIVCGVMLHDPWITVPNVASFFACGFALGLVWMYPPRKDGGEETAALASEQAWQEEWESSSVVSSPRTPARRFYGSVNGSLRRPGSTACSMGGTGETY